MSIQYIPQYFVHFVEKIWLLLIYIIYCAQINVKSILLGLQTYYPAFIIFMLPHHYKVNFFVYIYRHPALSAESQSY